MAASHGPAYVNAPYPMEQCIRAESKIRQHLIDLQVDPKLATEVLISMFPILEARNKKEIVGITQNTVRSAAQKILNS